jgi:hypothetical protein
MILSRPSPECKGSRRRPSWRKVVGLVATKLPESTVRLRFRAGAQISPNPWLGSPAEHPERGIIPLPPIGNPRGAPSVLVLFAGRRKRFSPVQLKAKWGHFQRDRFLFVQPTLWYFFCIFISTFFPALVSLLFGNNIYLSIII